MPRQTKITVVLLAAFLLLLAACGAQEVEDSAETAPDTDFEVGEEVADGQAATGSEAAGNPLPTPFTGAKVPPTRASTAGIRFGQIDVLFMGRPSHFSTAELEAVAAWFNEQPEVLDPTFALTTYGQTPLAEPVNFTSDVANILSALTPVEPASPTNTFSESMAAALQLAGWRPDSQHRLLFLIVDAETVIADGEMSDLLETAVAKSIQIFPVIPAGVIEPLWGQWAEQTNGHLLPYSGETPATGELEALIVTTAEEVSAGGP